MLAVSLVIVISDSTPVSADHADPTDSTWMPFIGEYKIWCTLATGVGACSTHHGTWGVDFDTPMNTPIYASGSGHLKQLYGGSSQTNGLFGSAIAVIGNDLIIGAPGTTISGLTNAGAIYYHTQ
ncbi:MAG: hypothetical protein QF596_00855 [Acidimicrobiales bacterium]|nr:hypothetical protein [Acidimicrobiales bacterium]